MGPGTRVITNVLEGVKPVNYVDALALQHDIRYLRDGEQFESDLMALAQADYSLQGALMKLGLLSRTAIDVLTHLIPWAPKFHLNANSSRALPEQQIHQLQHLAQPLVDEFSIELCDFTHSFDLLDLKRSRANSM